MAFDGRVTLREAAPTARRRLLRVALLAVLLGLGSAGCSSSSSDDGAGGGSDGTATTAGLHAQGVEFAECLRANGVSDFPDPDPSGNFAYGVSVRPEVWRRAVEACEELQPPGAFSTERDSVQQSAALEFAECMRANGVEDFPDPVDGEPLVDTTRIPSSEGEDGMRILDAAMGTCRDLAARTAVNQP